MKSYISKVCIPFTTSFPFRAWIQADSTNATTVLYKNLAALKNALPIDAIDSNTENTYESMLDSWPDVCVGRCRHHRFNEWGGRSFIECMVIE